MYTPPLRPLEPRSRVTEQRTLGYSVIDFAREMLQLELLPWQKWLLIHMLELLPDNSLRFRTVVVLVARQNGKSTLSQVLALWFMYIYGVKLILGTAQDLDTAEEVWEGAVNLVEELDENDEPLRPELHGLLARVVKNNGKKALVLKTGERYKVKAANRKAGRGLSGDLILLDELREHQSWDAWGSITKTTMARAFALVLALSNAGDATSIVLRYLRKMAHAAVGDPDGLNKDSDPGELLPDDDDLVDDDLDADDFAFDEDDEDTLGIFEWSTPPGCDIRDRNGWAQANPSLGYTITERTVAAACRTDPEWVFRTEVLCQWSEGSLEGPFPAGSWGSTTDEASEIAPGTRVALCVATSWDRSMTYVGTAGFRRDGVPHVEVIAQRTGSDWSIPWLTADERDESIKGAIVAVQSNNAPESGLIEPLRAAGVEVAEWKGTDLGIACGDLYDRVRSAVEATDPDDPDDRPPPGPRVFHRPQPVLDLAAATAATKPLGDAWVWDLARSPNDAAPLKAVTGALWALLTQQPEEKPPPAAPQVARLPEMSETAGLMGAGF